MYKQRDSETMTRDCNMRHRRWSLDLQRCRGCRPVHTHEAVRLAASSLLVGKPALFSQILSQNNDQASRLRLEPLPRFHLLKREPKIGRRVQRKTWHSRVEGLMTDIKVRIWEKIEFRSTNYKSIIQTSARYP